MSQKTVLIVEDEALLAMSTKMVLEGNGYKVTHVFNGEAAIHAVGAEEIDLILMDIDLGRDRMDGTETAERILQDHAIPIIFHTSHSEREMVDKVKGITRYGYVLKNAGEFVLLESIQMAFELFGAHQQIAEKEERYQYMFDYNRSSVAVLKSVDNGADFVFVDYNQTAEAVDTIRKEEVIGRRVTDVFPGAEAFGILEVFREVWRTGQSQTHTDAFYQDERISGWRESFVYRIPSGEIVSVYRDVTEEKETEHRLQVASNELCCLYEISRLFETEGITLPAILQGAVDLLPRYIDQAGKMSVRLTVGNAEYTTDAFRVSKRGKTVPVCVYGRTKGQLNIFCNKPDTACIQEEFLEGSEAFLGAVTERLGKIIERFEAVEELEKRKEDYRCILESIGDGVVTTDVNGNITRTNHIARELLGCTDADLLDTPLYDAFTLHNSADGAPLPNPVETVIATDAIITLSNHTKLVSKWGKELQIADSVAPVHDGAGETRGAVLVFRDETDKYEQEKRLRESEERYRRLFENMEEGFVRTNAAGEIVLVNQAAAELCGYDSVGDLTGRPMTDLYIDPRERSGFLARLMKDKGLSNYEFLLKKKNGDTIWTLCNIKAILDENGDLCGTEGLFRDYADKKVVELEREKNRRFLDSIFNAIQDFVSVHDADLNIKKANHIVHALFSERGPIEGEKCYRTFYGRSTPCEECPTLKAFATKQVHSCLKAFPDSGESKQYFELFAYPIIDTHGNVESVVEYARNITELKKNEEELVRTKELLQKMLQTLPEGFVMVNVEGEITYANQAAGTILEVYKDKITGSYYNDRKWKQIDEERNPYPLEELPLAVALRDMREVQNLVHGIVAPDGKTKWLSVNSAPLLDEKGELTGAIASFRDITEQKKLETALRESETYYRNVLQFLPVFVLDREYRYLHVNDLAAELVHMKAEDLVGKKITDLFPGFTETGFFRTYETVMRTGEAGSITAPFTLPDGNPGSYQVHVLPCAEGIQCVAVDITERERAKEMLQNALAESEELKRVVNNSPVCVFTWRNEEGWPAEYVSENVDTLLGYKAEDFISGEIAYEQLIHIEDRSRLREEVRHHLTSGKWQYTQEYRLIHKDGSVHWVEDRTFVEPDDAGNPDMIHGLVWDISQRKEAEAAVQQQLQEKELLIRETHHRIKNNIASIAGLLNLQAQATTNSEARAVLTQATGRVMSMRDLYDKMLASDDVRVIPVAPYMNDLIDSIMSLFAHQTGITVEKRIADFALSSDRLVSLGIIVNEVLTNSMKYAFAGQDTGIIRVTCETAGDRVTLVIEDDGVGLPEGFSVEHPSGFGTSLVTMLSKQMDGTVTFENRNGASVTVEFFVKD